MRATLSLCAILCVFLLNSCDNGEKEKIKKKNLLVYCGITMVHPMKEIAEIVEKKHNCKIKILKDASENLYNALTVNKVGDLYLPGSQYYMKKCVTEGLIIGQPEFVGHNQAALMIQKGNPKKILPDLNELLNKNIKIVLCNPETGSIGRETKKILEKKGIQGKAYARALYLTADSKDLTKAIKDKKADLVINWLATSFWPENKAFMESMEIDEKYAVKKKLLLGVLKTSKHPAIAREFIKLATSREGKAIFEKYGFLKLNDKR